MPKIYIAVLFSLILTCGARGQLIHEYIGKTKAYVFNHRGQPLKEGKESFSYYNNDMIIHFYYDQKTEIVHKIDMMTDDLGSLEAAYIMLKYIQMTVLNEYGFNFEEGNYEEGWYNYYKDKLNFSMHIVKGFGDEFFKVNCNIWSYTEKDLEDINALKKIISFYFDAIDNNRVRDAVDMFVPDKRNKMLKLLRKIAEETDYYKIINVTTVDGRYKWVKLKIDLVQKRWDVDHEEKWILIANLVRENERTKWLINTITEYVE